MSGPDLLEAGIYTVAQAAYLIGASERRVRGWIAGYPGRSVEPLVENELGWSSGRLALSFRNLLELRFIALFEENKVSINHIRAIMDEVRTITKHPHPFATNIVFRTDQRRIVGEITERISGKKIYDLKKKNFELFEVVYRTLKDDVVFDFNGNAQYWRPRKDIAPNVIVHPKFSFGLPILRDSKVPTQTLADAVAVEKSATVVAELFELPVRQVREAVRFETELRKAA